MHHIWVCITHHKTWHAVNGLSMHCAKWHNGQYYSQTKEVVDIGECYASKYWHGCNVGQAAVTSTKDELDQAEKIFGA